MKRALACLFLAFAMALSLAACGGGGDGSAQGSAAKTQEESTAENGASRSEGGEKSIEDFGAEASGAEREAILTAEQDYLSGLAEQEYGAACSHLAGQAQRSLEQLVAKGAKLDGCAAILPRLLSPSAGATARQQENGEVTKVRAEGDRAFIVFHAPGAQLYVFTMQREGNAWKATTVAASILVPSASTLGNE